MRRILALLALLLASSGAYAQTTTTITALPAVTAPAGTDVLAEDQSGCGSGAGTCKISLSQFLTYVDTNAVLTSAQTANTSGSAGSLSNPLALSGLATQATNTIVCNPVGSTATPIACNPLATANMLGASVSVSVVATSNITLSGTQTIDGHGLGIGETVLVAAQTTASQNGFYIVQSGAWTRAMNFPSGYVISQNCDFTVTVQRGAVYIGTTWVLNTLTGSLTIGTSTLTFTQAVAPATNSTFGNVKVTGTGGGASLVPTLGGTPAALGDVVSFSSTTGTIADSGNAAGVTGPPVVSDAGGHFFPFNTSGTTTANHGAVGCAAADNALCVTGVGSGTTSLTVTFAGTGGTAWTYTPSCIASSNAATPFAISVTAVSTASVTFTFPSLAGTTTFYIGCF